MLGLDGLSREDLWVTLQMGSGLHYSLQWEEEELLFNGYGDTAWEDLRVPEIHGCDTDNIMNTLNATELHTVRWLNCESYIMDFFKNGAQLIYSTVLAIH